MITVGVDLSAEPSKTVAAVLSWSQSGAEVTALHHRATDHKLVDLATTAEKIGIDCPLGWPQAFVDFVVRHQNGKVGSGEAVTIDARRLLAYRRTDLALIGAVGPNPLSVSADRIGHAAMRAAGLLAALAGDGPPLDRSGDGVVVEVYPAAALQTWGYSSRGYKRIANHDNRSQLVRGFFSDIAGWLTISDPHLAECVASDDAFDAVVAALNARAATIDGFTSRPDPADIAVAATEGWIAVPTCELAALDPRHPAD